MNWIALTKGHQPRTFILGTSGTLTWFDARAFACRMLSVDVSEIDVVETKETRPDAVLRWAGSDAGNPPTRELEVQFRDGRYGETFGEWVPIRLAEVPAWVAGEEVPAPVRAPRPAPSKPKKGKK